MSTIWVFKKGQRIDSAFTGTLGAVNFDGINSVGADFLTAHESWRGNGSKSFRTPGRYRLGSAEASLEFNPEPASSPAWPGIFTLEMKSNNAKDLVDLHMLIRAGKITPFVSYAEEQQKGTIRQYGDIWRELKLLFRATINNWIAKLQTS
jgi:hypothetical protein